jgi:hypothetical protein
MDGSASDQHTEAADPLYDDDAAEPDASGDGGDGATVRNIFEEESQGPNPEPYGISAADFADTPDGYQVLSMTFYLEDEVLIDDATDTPIENAHRVVGPISKAGFGGISGVENTRYVRNDVLEFDAEITLNLGSWVGDRLGYGKPK